MNENDWDIPEYGRLAVCSKGRLGIVTGKRELPWGLSFVGIGLDGKPWASREPLWDGRSVADLRTPDVA